MIQRTKLKLVLIANTLSLNVILVSDFKDQK